MRKIKTSHEKTPKLVRFREFIISV